MIDLMQFFMIRTNTYKKWSKLVCRHTDNECECNCQKKEHEVISTKNAQKT